MNNLHWAITASNELTKLPNGGGTVHWAVDIQVKHQFTEEQAISRAKQIVSRKHYFLRSVLECDCAEHNLHHRKQEELSKKSIELLKKQLGEDNG